MISIPTGVRIYLACGVTDMRKGFDGLSVLAQDVLKQDPFCGHLFAFRGRRGDLVKVLYWDGQGFCLFAKRLEKGRFTLMTFVNVTNIRSRPPHRLRGGWLTLWAQSAWVRAPKILDGRSSSYSGIGYPMMTVRRRAASLWPRTLACLPVQNKFEGSLYRVRRPGRYG